MDTNEKYKFKASLGYAVSPILLSFIWLFIVSKIQNIEIVETSGIVLLVCVILFLLYLLRLIILCIRILYDEELIVYNDRIEHYECKLFKRPVLHSYKFAQIDEITQSHWYSRKSMLYIFMEGKKYEIFTGCYKSPKEIYNTAVAALNKYNENK